MNSELRTKVEKHLRSLRAADTQASAVAWMTQAYKLFEECLADPDRAPTIERLFFVPAKPRIVIAQTIPAGGFKRVPAQATSWPGIAPTVVYPETPMPPPKPRPWTREDTRRLERAVKAPRHHVQRQGK